MSEEKVFSDIKRFWREKRVDAGGGQGWSCNEGSRVGGGKGDCMVAFGSSTEARMEFTKE